MLSIGYLQALHEMQDRVFQMRLESERFQAECEARRQIMMFECSLGGRDSTPSMAVATKCSYCGRPAERGATACDKGCGAPLAVRAC